MLRAERAVKEAAPPDEVAAERDAARRRSCSPRTPSKRVHSRSAASHAAASAQAVPGAEDSTDGSDGPFSGSVCPGGEMFAALVKAPARALGSDCTGTECSHMSVAALRWAALWPNGEQSIPPAVSCGVLRGVAWGGLMSAGWHTAWCELGTTHLGSGGGADDRRVLQPLHDARLETLYLRMQVAHLPLYLLQAQDDPSQALMRARTQAQSAPWHTAAFTNGRRATSRV